MECSLHFRRFQFNGKKCVIWYFSTCNYFSFHYRWLEHFCTCSVSEYYSLRVHLHGILFVAMGGIGKCRTIFVMENMFKWSKSHPTLNTYVWRSAYHHQFIIIIIVIIWSIQVFRSTVNISLLIGSLSLGDCFNKIICTDTGRHLCASVTHDTRQHDRRWTINDFFLQK